MNVVENANLVCDLNEIKEKIDFSNFTNLVLNQEEQKISLSFLYYICLKRLDKDFDDIEIDITDGGDDNNIDIFDINEDDDKCVIISLFQVKYKTNLNKSITNDEVDLFLRSVNDIFIDGLDRKMNDRLKYQILKYKGIQKEKVKFNLYLITNGSDLSKEAKDRLNKFEETNSIFKVFFLNSYQDLSQDYGDRVNDSINFPVTNDIIKYDRYINSVIVNMRLFDLAKLYEKYGERLFVENIRGYLKSDINNKIRKTIETDPNAFWYKNNGISIICKRFEHKKLEGQNSIEIEGIQIINGGQTTRCISEVYEEYLKNNNDRISDLYNTYVLVKIYQTTNINLINDITIGTNTQNSILLSDLLSKNENLNKMKEFFNRKGVDLIIKRDKSHKKTEKSIDNVKVFQSYCSIFKHKANIAKNNKTKLLKEEFNNVFNSNDTHFVENYFYSYELYIFVKEKISNNNLSIDKKILLDYAVFHILYLMNEIMKIKSNSKFEAYKESCKIIEKVKDKNKDISDANFFKSSNSMTEIDEELVCIKNIRN